MIKDINSLNTCICNRQHKYNAKWKLEKRTIKIIRDRKRAAVSTGTQEVIGADIGWIKFSSEMTPKELIKFEF